jgi:hypothetical protein
MPLWALPSGFRHYIRRFCPQPAEVILFGHSAVIVSRFRLRPAAYRTTAALLKVTVIRLPLMAMRTQPPRFGTRVSDRRAQPAKAALVGQPVIISWNMPPGRSGAYRATMPSLDSSIGGFPMVTLWTFPGGFHPKMPNNWPQPTNAVVLRQLAVIIRSFLPHSLDSIKVFGHLPSFWASTLTTVSWLAETEGTQCMNEVSTGGYLPVHHLFMPEKFLSLPFSAVTRSL